MQIQVTASDANNIICQVTPTPVQTVTIDRGVAGNGIVSIVPVTIGTLEYLRITYTNGTVADVGPITSTAYTAVSPISIVGNTISLLTVPVNLGGTGATTAAAGIQNLLPSYTGNGNKRLGLNSGATALEWVADGGGTVTSVAVSGGTTGLTTTGGPITGAGTITLTGTLATTNGGTGLSAFTANQIFYASSTSAIAQSANLTFDGTDFQTTGSAYLATSYGNVGVGTSTPSFKLDVDGIMRVKGYASASAGYILLGTDASETIYGGGSGGASNAISFSTNNQGALSLGGNGNINVLRTGARITGDFSNATHANRVAFQTSTVNGPTTPFMLPNGTGNTSGIVAANASDPTNCSFGQLRINGTTSVDVISSLLGTGTYLPLTLQTGGSERVRIDTSGNVGIGTSAPKSDVGLSLHLYNSANTGTVASNTYLLIESANRNSVIELSGSASATNSVTFSDTPGTAVAGIASTVADQNLVFRTGGTTERMRIDSSGNVGIGTSSTSTNRLIVYTSNANNTDGVLIRGGAATANVLIRPAMSAGANNGIVQAGDSGIIFDKNAENTGAFVIAPWASTTCGIRMDNAGNVGIGTSSPTTKLEVAGNMIVQRIVSKSNGGGEGGEIAILNPDNASDGLIIDVGTADVGRIFQVRNNSSLLLGQLAGTGGVVTFSTSATERARIDSSGNLLVGTTVVGGVGFTVSRSATEPYWQLTTNTATNINNFYLFNQNATYNGYRFYVKLDGGIANFSGNNVNLSDERTKTNIELAGSYLDKICAIPVKLFNYKDEAEGEQRTLGVIAQDVEVIAPEFVSNGGWEGATAEDGSPLKTIYSMDIMFALMKSIQELKAEFDAYKATHP